ncbi:MAG: hypothetical protein PHV68_10070, partial [Candidatus Gastranaerophilales bacterium]|nr:hypothetical protein [Candidatus Gastranaerophilales bacterium]
DLPDKEPEEEYLGEFIEAKAVEDYVKYSRVIELSMTRYGPEIDFVLEVSREKYSGKETGDFELEDGIYLGESKTYSGEYNLDVALEYTMTDKMGRYAVVTGRLNKELNPLMIVTGVIFAFGGGAVNKADIEEFTLAEVENEVLLRKFLLDMFVAFIPDKIYESDMRELTEREKRFIRKMIDGIAKRGSLDEAMAQRALILFEEYVLLYSVSQLQFFICDRLNELTGSSLSFSLHTQVVWQQVLSALEKAITAAQPVSGLGQSAEDLTRDSESLDNGGAIEDFPRPLSQDDKKGVAIVRKKIEDQRTGKYSPVRFAFRDSAGLSFKSLKITNVHTYLIALEKGGLRGIQAIRVERKKDSFRVSAIIAFDDYSIKEVYPREFPIGETGYPEAMDIKSGVKMQHISLPLLMLRQGYPQELFMTQSGKHVTFITAKLTCRINTFLGHMSVTAGDVRVFKYAPRKGRRYIEIRKRRSANTDEDVLVQIDTDEKGYPLGLDKGLTGFSLLEYLKERKIIDFYVSDNPYTISRSHTAVVTKFFRYTEVAGYFAYLDYVMKVRVVRLIVKQKREGLAFYGQVIVKTADGAKKVETIPLHTIACEEDGWPSGVSRQRKSVSIIKLLHNQGKIGTDNYREFKRTRRQRMFSTARDVRRLLKRRKKIYGAKSITVEALDKNKDAGGDRSLYFACLEFGIDVEGMKNPYHSKELAERELIRRASVGGELRNTPAALQKPKGEGGDWALYYAARRFEQELPSGRISSEELTLAEVEDRLKRRQQEGGEKAITYSAIAQSSEAGGDSQLLRAIDRLRRDGVRIFLADGVQLAAQERRVDSFVQYVNSYFTQAVPSEDYCAEVWRRVVIEGDTTLSDELTMALLGLVGEAVEIDLRMSLTSLSPESKSVPLVDYLLQRGAVALVERREEWATPENPTTIFPFFCSML